MLVVAPLKIELARFGKEAEFIRGNVVSHSLTAAHLLNAVHLFKAASIIARNRTLSKQPGRRSVRKMFVKILAVVHLFRTNLIHLPVDEEKIQVPTFTIFEDVPLQRRVMQDHARF